MQWSLIRQYLPKHASFAKLTTKEIKDIECVLNNRPRKKLGYRTLHEVFLSKFAIKVLRFIVEVSPHENEKSMDGNKVLEKLSWITQSKLAPQPVTQEYKERIYRFFENYVHFLQDNGFTTREILRKGEKATDESQITIGDLTEQGFKFYAFGILKWIAKYDRAKDKDKAIGDFSFIEKKLKEFREKHGG